MTGFPVLSLALLHQEAVRIGVGREVYPLPPQGTTQDLPVCSFGATPELKEVAQWETTRQGPLGQKAWRPLHSLGQQLPISLGPFSPSTAKDSACE